MNLTIPDISSFAYNLFALLGTSGSNGTSLDTYTGPNVLISPFSISSALGLLLAGATINSTCQEEIQGVLDVTSHLQLPMLTHEVLPQTSLLDNANANANANGADEHAGVKLTSANGIWSRDLRPSYINTITTQHNAVAEPLPANLKFDPINEYIETQTNGMLPNMLEGDIDPLTVAILVNAVHFKGDWTEQFNASDTEKGIFTTSEGVEQEADFMHASRKMMSVMDVKELDGADMVRLDYGELEGNANDQAEYAALFIKPKQSGKEAMDGVIQSLAALASGDGESPPTSSLGVIMGDQMSNRRKVDLALPRFKIEYGTQSIKSHLKTMGMTSVFDDEEVLMEMSSDKLVHLDDVLHKAVMEVTEEGTEAAAATVGIIMTRSMPMPPIDMHFDRPFVMVVVHVDTMTPLFLARVDDPQFSF